MEVNKKEDKYTFELGDMVEIMNVDGLNRVLYNEYSKGWKELIGLQGKTTCKNVLYYLVNLPIKNPRMVDGRFLIDGRIIFLGDNLKLIKRGWQ